MINIKFQKASDMLVSYDIKGHAETKAMKNERHLSNYDPKSDMIYDDVVCSAVSLLAQVCILGIEEVLHIKVHYKAEEGNIVLNLNELSLDDLRKTQVLMKTTLLGFKNLKINYGKYINLRVEEV